MDLCRTTTDRCRQLCMDGLVSSCVGGKARGGWQVRAWCVRAYVPAATAFVNIEGMWGWGAGKGHGYTRCVDNSAWPCMAIVAWVHTMQARAVHVRQPPPEGSLTLTKKRETRLDLPSSRGLDKLWRHVCPQSSCCKAVHCKSRPYFTGAPQLSSYTRRQAHRQRVEQAGACACAGSFPSHCGGVGVEGRIWCRCADRKPPWAGWPQSRRLNGG